MNRLLCGALLLAVLAGGCKPDADPLAEQGEAIASEKGCVSCHSVDGSKSVAPTWKGLHGSRVELDDGSVVTADDAYLRRSMLEPSAQTVKGFQKGLMETVIKPNTLTDEQVRALIAYIATLE